MFLPSPLCLNYDVTRQETNNSCNSKTVFGMGTDPCHLNPRVFKNPQEFDPMRWILTSDSEIQAMSADLHPYSRGSRECLGRQCVSTPAELIHCKMAKLTIRHYSVAHSIICAITAGLFQRYSLSIDGPVRNIDRISTFETLPKGGSIDLRIEPR